LNELYKLSKKKKITVALLLAVFAVAAASLIIYGVNSFAGIRITGSSEFSVLVLTVLSYTLLPLFTAFVCIAMFSGEFADNTIKSTLTGPAPRIKVFTAKVLAIATFIIADLLLIMLVSVAASVLLNGWTVRMLRVLISYAAAFFPLLIFALLVIAISNTVKGPTGAFMLSVLVFLTFIGLGFAFPGVKSFMFTSNFDWYRLLLGSYINFSKVLRVFLILSGYGIMLFGLGYYLFDKKEF
jgi:ABC-2 type transport system permease protein